MKKIICKKMKLYSIFQLLTVLYMAFFGIAIFLYVKDKPTSSLFQKDFWDIIFKRIFVVHSGDDEISTIGIVMWYLSIFAIVSSWIIGFCIVFLRGKTYIDKLFSFFIFFPIISNLIALASQLTIQNPDIYLSSPIYEKIDLLERKKQVDKEFEKTIDNEFKKNKK